MTDEDGSASRPSVQQIEDALVDLIGRHPTAIVGAIEGSEAVASVPVPSAVPVPAANTGGLVGTMDVVVAEDRPTVAALWAQAKAEGRSAAPVRLDGGAEHQGVLFMFDLQVRYGVTVAVFVAGPSDERLPAAVRHAPRYGRATKDAGAVFLSVDRATTEMLGWTEEELVGRRATEIVHPDDHHLGIVRWAEMLERPGPSRRVRLRHRRRDGSLVWLEVTNHNRLADPRHGDVLSEMVDISEEMEVVEALQAREQLLAQLTETVPVGLFHADLSGHLHFANRRLRDLTGVAATTLAEQLTAATPEDQELLDGALASAAKGVDVDIELDVSASDGSVRHCAVTARPLRDKTGTIWGLTGCVEDVTDMVRSRRELEARAAADPLTGCLNRATTMATLQEVIDVAHRTDTHRGTAVIFVDVDDLKLVNDQHGHATGDQLLLAVAERIRSAVRTGDTVGRFGGDEFVVVCPGVPSPANALAIARSIGQRACQPLDLPGIGRLDVRASMGVTWTDRSDVSAARLVHVADEAMYEAKRAASGVPVLTTAIGS